MAEATFGTPTNGKATWRVSLASYDWSDVYYLDEATTLYTPPTLIGPGWGLGDKASWVDVIFRSGIAFDTTGLPSDAAISSAKVTLQARFYHWMHADFTAVSDVIMLYRAPALDLPNAEPPGSDFGYMRGCNVYLGGLLIHPGMEDYAYYEIELNAAGMASIVPGGITRICMKANSDTPTAPTRKTYFGCGLTEQTLVVTYEHAGELKVITLLPTDATKDAATLNGEITQGVASYRGFDYGESGEGAAEDLTSEWYEEGTFYPEEFSHGITGLTPGAKYCFRAKASE